MTRYKMIGKDINKFGPSQFRTWENNTPDLTGSSYTGDISGSLPLENISVSYVPDGYVQDFNLPNPLLWQSTRNTLPTLAYNSQLAVIDGYIYLFGGENSNKILRATTATPTDWKDTGSTLPSILSRSQLAVVDGYIYLFGGHIDNPTNHIYSALTTDPLTWTDHGALLPRPLSDSQLLTTQNYIYLFGGRNKNGATASIFRAPTSNPLSWTDTNSTLTDAIYASSLGVVDGYVYLYGGLLNNDQPSNVIYISNLDDLTTWGGTPVNYLPINTAYAKFVRVGDKCYLICNADSNATTTSILRCDSDKPTQFIISKTSIPGDSYQTQLGIIDDCIYLFGGNGNTVIFSTKMIYKYKLSNTTAVSYGEITRTNFIGSNILDSFSILGFPAWITNYKI